MIDFDSIEFFFANTPHRFFEDFNLSPPLTKKQIQEELLPPPVKQRPFPQEKKGVEPLFTPVEKTEPNKEPFYSKWEEKYKTLHAENLLAKEPFKRYALFVVDQESDSPFAKKICEAISSRLIKTTYCVIKGSLKELIDTHQPSHLILTFIEKEKHTLPVIRIDEIKTLEKDLFRKKEVWERLKTTLRS